MKYRFRITAGNKSTGIISVEADSLREAWAAVKDDYPKAVPITEMDGCIGPKGRVHKDCPFSEREIEVFKDMLYNVNTGNHCANPASVSWFRGTEAMCLMSMDGTIKDFYDEK